MNSVGEACLKEFLIGYGFAVTPIPTRATEKELSADWLIEIAGTSALVEVKDRNNDPAVLAKRSALLRSGQIDFLATDIAPTAAISRTVRKSVDQLNASGRRYPHDFKLSAFVGLGINAYVECEQFLATLYGTETVVARGENSIRPCYFFHESEFHRNRETLDGAVATYLNGATLNVWLCVNPLSPRYSSLSQSSIIRAFPETALRDPRAEALDGHALVLDGDHDRRDTARSFGILSERLGKPVMPFGFSQLSASLACDW